MTKEKKPKPKGLLQVTQSFAGSLPDGTAVHYFQGELVYDDDPAVSVWPMYFADPIVRAQPVGLIPTIITPEEGG